MSPRQQGIILVGHGSKMPGFEQAMLSVVQALQQSEPASFVQPAYLDINAPSIEQAIEEMVKMERNPIKVLPYFLLTGKHVQIDIPNIVLAAKKKYPNSEIQLCASIGFDPKLVEILKQRLGETIR